MNIGVIGTGYVGLVVGACFAESGNDVVCIDNNAAKIAKLQEGVIPIYEPGLPEIIERNVREERLTFSTDLEAAVKKSFIIFIAVGTPTSSSGAADLSAIRNVAGEIVKSQTKHPFDVVSNPEFLKQGAAVEDFMKPDRVVVGADQIHAGEILRDLYAPFVRTGRPVMMMDIPTAELL